MEILGKKINLKRQLVKYLGWYLIAVAEVVFKTSVATFIVYLALEGFKTGLISNYFDLNWLLIVAIVSGGIVLIFGPVKEQSIYKKRHFVFNGFFAILLGLYCWLWLADYGLMAKLIALAMAMSLLIIIHLGLKENYD